MSYPLIIVGAGASKGYLIQENLPFKFVSEDQAKWKSPLMNELFDNKRFDDVIGRHLNVRSIASEIAGKLLKKVDNQDQKNIEQENFESILTDLKNNKAKNNQKIYGQLIALIYYLADLFQQVSLKYYHPINNYKYLLQQIDHFFKGKACFVSFNYDLLLERSIEEQTGSSFITLDNFITGNIKVIKLHGSCNWVHNPVDIEETKEKYPTSESFFAAKAESIINNNERLEIYPTVKDISKSQSYNIELNSKLQAWVATLPALALPLNDEKNYVCPDNHISTLKQCIKEANKVLIIGWRAMDPFLIDNLEQYLPGNVPVAIVSGSKSKQEVMPNLGKIKNKVTTIGDKFTKFITTGILDRFLTKKV